MAVSRGISMFERDRLDSSTSRLVRRPRTSNSEWSVDYSRLEAVLLVPPYISRSNPRSNMAQPKTILILLDPSCNASDSGRVHPGILSRGL